MNPQLNAAEVISHLTTFHRVQGTPALLEAAQYLTTQAQRLGLQAHLHTAEYDGETSFLGVTVPLGWECAAGHVRLLSPQEKLLIDFAAAPLCVLPFSPPGKVAGNLVEPDEEWSNVTGHIALTSDEPLRALRRAAETGARGVLFFTERAEDALTYRPLYLTKHDLQTCGHIPLMQVRPSQGEELHELLQQGTVTLEINVESRFGNAPLPIVEAFLPGSENGEILFVAHLCHPCPGANDNASGAAGLLEVAQKLQQKGPSKKGFRFLWVPEFFGSLAWLFNKTHGSLPEACINLDMIAAPISPGVLTLCDMPWSQLHPINALLEEFLTAANQWPGGLGGVRIPRYLQTATSYTTGSDHDCANLAGIPASMLITWPDAAYHSDHDIPARLDMDVFALVTRVAAEAAWTYANGFRSALVEKWAFRRLGQLDETDQPIFAYFCDTRLGTSLRRLLKTEWSPQSDTPPIPLKVILASQQRHSDVYSQLRAWKAQEPRLWDLALEATLLSKFLCRTDISTVLRAEFGEFSSETFEHMMQYLEHPPTL